MQHIHTSPLQEGQVHLHYCNVRPVHLSVPELGRFDSEAKILNP